MADRTVAQDVELDYLGICNQAIGSLARCAVLHYVERDELVGVGCLAIVTAGVTEEALAVTVARRAMFNLIDRNKVRSEGRETVRYRDDESPAGDVWDSLIYASAKVAPVGQTVDVWEGMKVLPAREFTVVMRHFWGGETQAAIAVDMGVDQKTVSRILASAKINLKSYLNGKSQLMTLVEGKKRGCKQDGGGQ